VTADDKQREVSTEESMIESCSRRVGRLALLAALLAASTGALAQKNIFVVSPAVLDPDAPIAPEVKAECRLPEVTGDNTVLYVQRHLRHEGTAVRISDLKEAGDGRALLVTIVAAYGQGATMYSGHKSITLRADLIEGGKVIDSRILRQSAKMGSFLSGGWGGGCDIFARASRAVANRVGNWARGAGAPVQVAADRRVAVESPASVDPTAPFHEAVKQECAVPMMLSTHVFDRVSIQLAGSRMVRPGEATEGKLLRLTILQVNRPEAEGTRVAKNIVARADVLDGGKVIANREFERATKGSLYATTCLAFEMAAISIGQQVAQWLPGVTNTVGRDKPLETIKEDAEEAEGPAEK